MKATYSVRFKGAKDYEMHDMSITLDENDLSSEFNLTEQPIRPGDLMAIAQVKLILHGLAFQRAMGYISTEDVSSKVEELLNSPLGRLYGEVSNERRICNVSKSAEGS